jgi:hypothetical protein
VRKYVEAQGSETQKKEKLPAWTPSYRIRFAQKEAIRKGNARAGVQLSINLSMEL